MTLPLREAITSDTFVSSPGLSGSSTDTVKIRSLKISPCCTTEDIVIISIFPPLRIETIRFPFTFKRFRAATVSKPEFSTTILWFSTISKNATTNSSSSTVKISSRFFLI